MERQMVGPKNVQKRRQEAEAARQRRRGVLDVSGRLPGQFPRRGNLSSPLQGPQGQGVSWYVM